MWRDNWSSGMGSIHDNKHKLGEELSGTLISWVNNAYTCVMIASV